MLSGTPARFLGIVILVPSMVWAWKALATIEIVSPVHWGLIAPHMVSTAVPGVLGLIAGAGLALRGRGGRTMLVVLAVTALQALTVSALTPNIGDAFTNTVEQSRDTLTAN